MTSSNSIIQRIFRRVFLKKHKKSRGRTTRPSKIPQNDKVNPSVATSNDISTIDTTNYYNNNNIKTFNNNDEIDTNKFTPPFVMSPPNRASTGQPRRDWRSGYKPIDELIQEIRLEFPYPSHNLNWIPYDEFVGSRLITQGGFSSIFEAMWNKSGQTVALKCLKDSQDLSSDYLNEIKTHWGLFSQPQFLRCYGITQYPITGEFMIVLQYASFGDLRLHLQRNRVSSWKDKIRILKQIARGLAEMHKKDLIHGNLHSGNIMNIDKSHFVIGDVGLCGPANRNIRKKAVYGVLPYVAPELFRGIGSSKKVDIYSFGIIMWEICSGMRPYAGTAHDINMAKDICKGKRPPVPPGTPSFYSELMKKCWHHNPNERPDAPEVLKTVYHWLVNDSLDEFLRKGGSTISFNNVSNDRTHPDAIYCSRLLDFPELREERRRQILAHSRADLKNNSNNNSNRSSIDQNNSLRPPQIYKPLLSKSSEDTLRSRTSQKTDNTSKQSFNTSIPRPSQRINNYSKTPQERYNNNSSQDSYNYSKSSQTSYYGHTKPSQNILENHNYSKSLQHSPIIPTQTTRPELFGKSELSINPKGPVSGLSVFIPDDDVETLTSFWSMEGPKPNDKNSANNFRL